LIEIGKYHELEILRETSVGLFLGDEEGEDILLPNKYMPESYDIGDKLTVFVYRDYAERKIATNLTPKILLNEFALLEVTDVSDVGAFLDWGLEKNLMVPFKEQRQKMIKGRWYVVCMELDTQTDRLFASNKIEKRLNNEELSVKDGDEVGVLVYQKTDIGYSVIINNKHKGLIFENEIFQELRIGDKLTGFVKKIREENKLDITLQPIGFKKFNDANMEAIYNALINHGGHLPLTDKSPPGIIYSELGMSKKAFKKAVGSLYKERKITIESAGIKISSSDENE